jgi:hypothetical protein
MTLDNRRGKRRIVDLSIKPPAIKDNLARQELEHRAKVMAEIAAFNASLKARKKS